MDWFARFRAVIDELEAIDDVRFVECVLTPEELEIEDDFLEDVLADGGFVVDRVMRAFFDAVHEVNVVWTSGALDEATGHPIIAGKLDIGAIDDIVFSGYTEPDLKFMGPRDAEERAFLLAMRHIDTHNCAGDHWLALLPDSDGVPALWWRSPVQAGVDIPLDVDFEGLLELMLSARGALGWPILCARLDGLGDEARNSLLHDISGPGLALRHRLEILAETSAADDANRLIQRLDEIVATSAARFV